MPNFEYAFFSCLDRGAAAEAPKGLMEPSDAAPDPKDKKPSNRPRVGPQGYSPKNLLRQSTYRNKGALEKGTGRREPFGLNVASRRPAMERHPSLLSPPGNLREKCGVYREPRAIRALADPFCQGPPCASKESVRCRLTKLLSVSPNSQQLSVQKFRQMPNRVRGVTRAEIAEASEFEVAIEQAAVQRLG